ncbi:MAG: hypothetical protein K6F26_06610 [Lachnospiraceae bacterium]|nr:hypothetical protein [Lachnospiraceae bacterium]
MRRVRKLVALLLSLAMVLAMSGMAMATSGPDSLSNGKYGNGGANAVKSDTEAVNIVKELMPVNPENSTINAPTITYTYAISAGASDKSITDSYDVKAKTKEGVLTGLSVKGSSDGTATAATAYSSGDSVSTTISWTTAKQLIANTVDTQNLVIDFSGVEFPGAGVYRYVITETVDYSGTGVTATSGTHTRYLDVYVMDGTGTGADAWDVYGYVCAYADNDIIDEGTDTNTNNISDISKTNGFVAGTNNAGTAVTADTYYTFNVTISKTLTGDAFSNNYQFPFVVTFVNTNITKNVDIIGDKTGTATAADIDAGPLNASITKEPKIANGGTVTYVGIPVGTTVTVKETNDVTGTIYKSTGVITTAETNDSDAAEKQIATGDDSNVATIASTAVGTAATGNKTVAFANVFELISPTGLMFRYGPYALILICGFVLLFLGVKFMRRNKEED